MFIEITPEWLVAISALAWPFIVIVAVFLLWPHTHRIMKQATNVTFKIGDYELTASQQTADILVKPILDELTDAVNHLNDEQKIEFRRIYNRIVIDGGRYFVPGDFVRESEQYNILRGLRNVNFIRPVIGGRWEANKEIEIKNFGKLAAKLKSRELGFKD